MAAGALRGRAKRGFGRAVTGRRPSLRLRALRSTLARRHGGAYRAFRAACTRPAIVQANLLKKILTRNADTHFGARYGFSGIDGPRSYQDAAPVRTYDHLREYIQIQERTEQPFLTAEQPVYYHCSSGTTGGSKHIPVTEAGLLRARQHQELSDYAAVNRSYAFEGKVLGITGQAFEGLMPGGVPYGSLSSLLFRRMPESKQRRHVLPPAIADIADHESRCMSIAALALAEPNITCIQTPVPSTVVRLLNLIRAESETLIRAVADGRLPDGGEHAGVRGFSADRPRARELERVLATPGALECASIWPKLSALITRTGGNCKLPLQHLCGSLSRLTAVIELGYGASEFQGTVNVDVLSNICPANLQEVFFEFAPRRAWEDGKAEFLLLHELEAGRDYYLFVTTQEGLYRYDTNDVVRVSGSFENTPCLEFVQRGAAATDMRGERLCEDQLVQALMQVCAAVGMSLAFSIMLADEEEAGGYRLYLETAGKGAFVSDGLSASVDRALREVSIEYDGARGSGRLPPLEIKWLRPGTGSRLRDQRVAAGQRDVHFDHLHLQNVEDCPFDFDACAEAA